MWKLKNDTNELIYKTETDSQTYKTNLWSPKGMEREGINQEVGINIYTLEAQMVKNLPAMQEIWALSLDWKDSLEKGKALHFSILA